MQGFLHPLTCGVPASWLQSTKANTDKANTDLGWASKAWRKIASLYIDDICVHGPIHTHVNDLAKVLKRLKGNNVSLKMVKCEFAVTKGKFLGHIVHAGKGISSDPKKVQGIVQMQRPKTVADLRTLLGASSYLRKFIPDFADVTRPLRLVQNHFFSKHATITEEYWSEDCENSFNTLKASLACAPLLAYPDFNKPFIVCCDASGTQLGAALCQLVNGVERPIAYASRALTESERKWGITDLEGAAVVWALRMWRPYLISSKVVIITDHSLVAQNKPAEQTAGTLCVGLNGIC